MVLRAQLHFNAYIIELLGYDAYTELEAVARKDGLYDVYVTLKNGLCLYGIIRLVTEGIEFIKKLEPVILKDQAARDYLKEVLGPEIYNVVEADIDEYHSNLADKLKELPDSLRDND